MVLIVYLNVKVTYRPGVKSLLKELRSIRKRLDRDADIEMQGVYPEGYVFLNSIYSLAWCNLLGKSDDDKIFAEGFFEIAKASEKINSSAGSEPFDEELSLPLGAFYNGWATYVLGSKLRVQNPKKWDQQDVSLFKSRCKAISTSIQERTYPMSYYGGAWPADVVVCVSALAMHDNLFKPQYDAVIRSWLDDVKNKLDDSGMIPHSVHPIKGTVGEGARGSSMALMLIFLAEIDQSFAREQFKLFRSNFIDQKLGLTGVREYPLNKTGFGDIDSGPVILGFGGAATIVGMQTLSQYGEQGLAIKVRNGVEGLAFGFEGSETKSYLFGVLPIADAFIAWSHSGMNKYEAETSFTRFRIYSLMTFLLLSVLFWMFIADKKPDSGKSLNVSW